MAIRAPNELIDELVHQFTDPFAFYRELIQNSIDAGSSRIEVVLRYRPTGKTPMLAAQVSDWGEGMSRTIIDDYLLTKFRSSKEDDLTKIGKFGIGFVSVFACAPDAVVVDTGRDGEAWRVLFKADRSHELIRLDRPVDGTSITLHKAMGPRDYDAFVAKSFDAVRRWCRHSEVDVAFSAGHSDGQEPPPPTSVREALAIDAPYQVEHVEDGLKVVAGVPRRRQQMVGLYNRGLTLLESNEELVPGVAFKAVSRWLEHTLTRDNVRRDKAFQNVVKRARALAEGPLLKRLPDELRRCAHDPALRGDWEVLFDYAQTRLKPKDLWLRRPGGGALNGASVLKAVHGGALVVAPQRTPVVERLDGAGVPVIEGVPTDPVVQLIRSNFEARFVHVADLSWTHGEPVPAEAHPAFLAALREALALVGAVTREVTLTRVHGAGAGLPFVALDMLGQPLLLERAEGSPFGKKSPRTLCLNTAHPDIARLGPLFQTAPRLTAMLISRRVAVTFSALTDSADRALTAWALL